MSKSQQTTGAPDREQALGSGLVHYHSNKVYYWFYVVIVIALPHMPAEDAQAISWMISHTLTNLCRKLLIV